MKGVKDLYTRNYRIQRGERTDVPHADSPVSSASEDLTPKFENGVSEPVFTSEADEIPREPPSIEAEASVTEVSEVQAEKREPTEPHNEEETFKQPIKKLRAVKSFRVRSANFCPSPPEPHEDIDTEITEPCAHPKNETESIHVTPAAIFNDQKDEPTSEAPCDKPRKDPDRHFDKPMGKKPFGLPPLSLKGFSNEDIFLCAIILLLINEGCEDIMILILGFLLIS